jgi:regulator of sigma E protease
MLLSSILSVLLAMLALSAIIFIHELGHLLAALFVKMRVNTFSIGFGPALKSWKWRDIEWKISMLPLGGYVSIHGLDDTQTGPGSYYSVSVIKRLFVIAMGPIANFILAWLLFAGIHYAGGQEKPFSEVTSVAGWIDPSSELSRFVKPGDLILGYDGQRLSSAKDHIYLPLLAQGEITVDIQSIDYEKGTREEKHIKVATYPHPEAVDSSFKTAGIFSNARWLIIDGFSGQDSKQDTLANSGVLPGDRLVAVNGERLFSDRQLLSVLNAPSVWLEFQRGTTVFSTKVPLIALEDLEEVQIQLEWRDWLFSLESDLPLMQRRCLPFNLNLDAVIEAVALKNLKDLQVGDRLLSVNGEAFESPQALCKLLQDPPSSVIVYRAARMDEMSLEDSQKQMYEVFTSEDLEALLGSASGSAPMQKGAFIRLEPVSLMTFEHLAGDSLKQWKEQASLIVEESAKERVLKRIEEKSREKVLGVRLVDQVVLFNPSVSSMMVGALKQIGSALNALLTGQLSIKWMAGPVGMVTIVTQGFSVGLKQAFYWLAMISLNLGLFNLLPLPMFDGGRIVIELVETLTGRRIPAAVMEFLTYALFIGLIALFLVATYWDISRLATLWQG